MPSIPVTSASAVLENFAAMADAKLGVVLLRAIQTHHKFAQEVTPAASAVRAAAEANLKVVRGAGLTADIENAYQTVSKGGEFDDIGLGDNPLEVADAALEEARRYEVACKKAELAARDFVAVCAREESAKMWNRMEKAWGKVAVKIDPSKTTVAEAAAAEGLSEILVRVMASVAIILEQPSTRREASQLRAAYEAKPDKLPRLQPIRDQQYSVDKARRDKTAAVQAKAAAVRAQMSGSAVSTGRMDLSEAEKAAISLRSRRITGHLTEQDLAEEGVKS